MPRRRPSAFRLEGGFAVVDVSTSPPAPIAAAPGITRDRDRPAWPGPGAHSAIKFWDRDWAWVSDVVYGTATAPDHGCPWGWARIVKIEDPRRPRVLTDYRLPQNDPDECDRWEPRPRTSFQLAEFFPRPLDEVMLEDPRLSSDSDTGNKGPSAKQVGGIAFLEGNSNKGDAPCFDPVGPAGRHCD